MNCAKTLLAVVLFLLVSTGVYFVQCTNEKGKTETGKQPAGRIEAIQKAPEEGGGENKTAQAEQTVAEQTVAEQAVAEQAVKEDSGEQKNDTSKQTVKKESTKQENSIKVTFIELGSVKCIPCKMMQPIMEEIEKEYGDQVKVVFYDVWTPEGQPYARQYGVRAIPTQVFLDAEGKEYYRHSGFFPKEELVKVLQKKGVK